MLTEYENKAQRMDPRDFLKIPIIWPLMTDHQKKEFKRLAEEIIFWDDMLMAKNENKAKDSQTVWVVGKVVDHKASAWEFQGVFSTKEKAVAACREVNYFVGPATVDVELPDDHMQWLGAFYPKGIE